MTNIWSLNNTIIRELVQEEKNEKLDKKDFFRRLIQEVLDKKQKNGCDFLDIWSRTL
jgi:hypothetical protein